MFKGDLKKNILILILFKGDFKKIISFVGASNAKRSRQTHSKSLDLGNGPKKVSPGQSGGAGASGRRTISYPSKDREAFRQALVHIIM